MRKQIIGIIIFMLVLAGIIAWFQHAASGVGFFVALIGAVKVIVIVAFILLLIYYPFIKLIQYIWKKRSAKLDLQHNQQAKAINRFIKNGNALIGSITIFYAILLALFAHLIAPDITPYANDQINELPFKEPGYTTMILQQPLE